MTSESGLKRPQKTPAEVEASMVTGPCSQLLKASIKEMGYTDFATSMLGKHNIFARYVTKRDTVWLFDNIAYRNKKGLWEAEFVAAYFRDGSGKEMSAAVADIAEKLGFGEGDEAEKTIAERLQPFADIIEPARMVDVRIGHAGELRLGPSGPNGISSDVHLLPGTAYVDGKTAHPQAIFKAKDDLRQLKMNMHVSEPEGWTIVSDIDDTIKITMTHDGLGILRTTFVDDPTPVLGMPELYQRLDAAFKPSWFYLSASPYNLYPFLRGFRDKFYPSGTIILRDASWMNLGGFISSLTMGTEGYKEDRLEKIYGWLPTRKTICIGDSTQTDPEAYGTLAINHPGWIKAIFIRVVSGIDEAKEKKLNAPERFENAFKGIDSTKVLLRTFKDPSEVVADIAALTA